MILKERTMATLPRISLMLFILFMFASFTAAQDAILSSNRLERFYSSNAGPKTALLTTRTGSAGEILQLWVFDSPTNPRLVKDVSSIARPRMVDLYWNSAANVYVVSWLESKAKLMFATYNPNSGAYAAKGIKLKKQIVNTKKTLRSCRTTYNSGKNVYLAAVSDGEWFSFVEINASSYKINGSKTWRFTSGSSSEITEIAATVYSKGLSKYFICFYDPDDDEFMFSSFNSYDDEKWKVAGRKYFWGDVPANVSLYAFPLSVNSDHIFMSFNEDNPSAGIFYIFTNYLNSAGAPGAVYWEYEIFAKRPFGVPAIDAAKKQAHFIAIEESEYEPDLDIDFEPALRLYSVGSTGARLNGESGIAIRKTPAVADRAGAAVVNGSVVVIYSVGGKTYYGPWDLLYR